MYNMNITFAQYKKGGEPNDPNSGVRATIDGKVWCVPLDPANRHYDEIMRQVNAGTLTIQDAD